MRLFYCLNQNSRTKNIYEVVDKRNQCLGFVYVIKQNTAKNGLLITCTTVALTNYLLNVTLSHFGRHTRSSSLNAKIAKLFPTLWSPVNALNV